MSHEPFKTYWQIIKMHPKFYLWIWDIISPCCQYGVLLYVCLCVGGDMFEKNDQVAAGIKNYHLEGRIPV